MADPVIPTPQDTQLLLQDLTSKTASYNTPGLDLGSGFAPGGLGRSAAAVVQVTTLDTADGNESYSFVMQESNDNATFVAAGAATAVTAAGVAAVKGRITRRFVRLALTTGGTTPAITFRAWLNPLP